MKIHMTDDDVLRDYHEALGFIGRYTPPTRYPSTPDHCKPIATWELTRKDQIFELVMLFYPFMYTRRRSKMREFLSWYFRK
jgi:hypothetical protein